MGRKRSQDTPIYAGDMSESIEMYLISLYKLGQEHQQVGNSLLAKRLGVSTASITGMMKKLAEKGLISRQGRGIFLRPKGKQIVLKILRKHRLVERWLTDHLGVPWDHAHEQACSMEHCISDLVADALDEYLGHPTTCPHGHPIPDSSGNLEEDNSVPLAECSQGSSVVVTKVSESSLELLRYFDQIGLKPGTSIYIEDIAPFEGPLLIKIQSRNIPFSRSMAKRVWVRQESQKIDKK